MWRRRLRSSWTVRALQLWPAASEARLLLRRQPSRHGWSTPGQRRREVRCGSATEFEEPVSHRRRGRFQARRHRVRLYTAPRGGAPEPPIRQRGGGHLKAAERELTGALRKLTESGRRARCVHRAAKLAELRVLQGRYEEAERLAEGYEALPGPFSRREWPSHRHILSQNVRNQRKSFCVSVWSVPRRSSVPAWR
jgi:hypothetical protein